MKSVRYSKILNPYWSGVSDEIPPESAWMHVNVEDYWEEVAQMDPETQLLDELSDYYFWQVTLNHMELGKEFADAFWKSFFTPKAKQSREVAKYGLPGSRRIPEATLVKAARAYWDWILPDLKIEDASSHPLYADDDGREWDCERIGWEFVRLVTSNDTKAFKRLGDAASVEPGSEMSADDAALSKAWRGFCLYVQKHQTLPTIAEFQAAAGLSNDDNDRSYGSKRRKQLGIRLPISRK